MWKFTTDKWLGRVVVLMATASNHNHGGATSVDVVVVGAGISGLCAAYDILKTEKDSKIVVLEAKGNVARKI